MKIEGYVYLVVVKRDKCMICKRYYTLPVRVFKTRKAAMLYHKRPGNKDTEILKCEVWNDKFTKDNKTWIKIPTGG